ncbi:MAG: HAD hydrolase family protein, partial [Coprobacillus cateniformis]
QDVVNHKVYQCMCFVDNDEEKELMKVMPHCISARWHPLFCDVSPIGGTKQNGIDKFLEHYHIDLSETMAFGDGGNDIQMLNHVAVAIAMGNANDEVKAIADYVTDDVDNDGITKALRHFGLLSK